MLVLSGHPLLGIVVEIFGFLNLFGNLFPLFTAMLKNLPFFSNLNGGPPQSPGGAAAAMADLQGAYDTFQSDYQ